MNGPDCPWCGLPTDAEFVDIGVAMQQVTGGHCFGTQTEPGCGAHEMGPYLVGGFISEVEMASLWRGPYEDYPELSSFNPYREEQDYP